MRGRKEEIGVDETVVEGFRVVIERIDDGYFATAPRLPGCSVQAESIEGARGAMREMIGLYMMGLASRKAKSGSKSRKRTGREGRARRR